MFIDSVYRKETSEGIMNKETHETRILGQQNVVKIDEYVFAAFRINFNRHDLLKQSCTFCLPINPNEKNCGVRSFRTFNTLF